MIQEIKEVETSDFLLAIQREGAVELTIENISEVRKSKYDEGSYFFIDFKVNQDLIYQEENLKDSVVGVSYPLKNDNEEGYFVVSEKQKIYPLLQYAVNQNGHRIKSSFKLNENDIKENLEGLTFKGAVENKNNITRIKAVK